jgi:hypothetical protein
MLITKAREFKLTPRPTATCLLNFPGSKTTSPSLVLKRHLKSPTVPLARVSLVRCSLGGRTRQRACSSTVTRTLLRLRALFTFSRRHRETPPHLSPHPSPAAASSATSHVASSSTRPCCPPKAPPSPCCLTGPSQMRYARPSQSSARKSCCNARRPSRTN